MGFYEDRVLPHLVNLAMRDRNLLSYRERIIAAAKGRVLEIGIGHRTPRSWICGERLGMNECRDHKRHPCSGDRWHSSRDMPWKAGAHSFNNI